MRGMIVAIDPGGSRRILSDPGLTEGKRKYPDAVLILLNREIKANKSRY